MKYKITYDPKYDKFFTYLKQDWWDVYRVHCSYKTLSEAEKDLQNLARKEVIIKHGRI